MFVKNYFFGIVVGLCALFALAMKATVYQAEPPKSTPKTDETAFANYWFGGKAEISSYDLQQAQYGALNPGEAVLVFVTEDFRTDTQVKSESEQSRQKATPVLKLNAIKRFNTGVYDYSLYTSVFTPINRTLFPQTLKVSFTAQDWCGQTFTQLNARNSGFQLTGRSYFENEVVEDYSIEKALLEDEIWTRLRLNPSELPTGKIKLIPSVSIARLRKQKMEALPATATLTDYAGKKFTGKMLKTYTIQYADERQLAIVFEGAFPHQIVGWEDTYTSRGKALTTRAVLKKSLQSDYWNKNAPQFAPLRDSLRLR
ncbi:MAG: hypothetical protein EAZ32_19140 [Cytophagia bacterium]|nr:MAG: hypothetical protein EAZ46_12340 [Runella sp.]TAG24061.1 MAG: hypothetical protein EAZ38_01855 [Cytophagales bacterium]TAG34847.1 MAG: hypothetical protein EAZ32_19140 [Cytophagia bacterium]TAG58979.1 MAG: hypothetical protein EAZ29_00180 [Runella slithyformis]TAG67596.1 MAG: hypothetical protein EAZ26_08780 [Runella slithyformis]